MKRNAFLFLLTSLFCSDCLSQHYPFISYTPKDGLVSNNGRSMFQDSKGLLYISTMEGLSVYDGSRFTNYTTKNGLISNFINDVVEMGEDSLWLMPNAAGINCMVRGRIKTIHTSDGFYPIVNKMFRRQDGSYYALSDQGLFRLEKDRFIRVELKDGKGNEAGGFFVQGMERNNRLFIATDPHVQSIAGPGRLIVYDQKRNSAIIHSASFVFSVVLSPAGDILVSTREGLRKLDEAALQNNIIRFTPLPSIYRSAEKTVATNLYVDSQKNLWLCTQNGMLKMDTAGNCKLFSEKNGLPVNAHESVFEDKEHTLWFVNDQTGISKLTSPQFEFFSPLKDGFSPTDISASPHSDSVWFLDAALPGLLLHYRGKIKEFALPAGISKPTYRHFVATENGYFLSDLFNIYQCVFTGNKKIRLASLLADTNRNGNLAFGCLTPDGYGNLLALNDHIIVIRKDHKILSYALGYLADELAITADGHLWVADRINQLYVYRIHPEDSDHYLEPLKVYDKQLPVCSPRSITADRQGNVWIGTRDHGLFCFFFDGLYLRSWKQITIQNGLSDNFISYLHADTDSGVWACSPAGLDRIRLQNGAISIENTTVSDNIYQHVFKIQTTKSGVRWATTPSGTLKISPGERPVARVQPKIIFREIKVGANRVDPGDDTASFSHEENNIHFSLAVPSFIDEKQIRFSYLLGGSGNHSWSEPSSQSVIDFVNLAPGKYTLQVKAGFLNGRYAGSDSSYSFIIRPAWWQTSGFRILWISLLIILSGWLIRNYYGRKFRQQAILLDRQQAVEKERARIATDMHDDLGAGLSSIRFLSEKVKQHTTSLQTKADLEKIQSASSGLIDKMNEIIWSMNENNNSLENLIFYTRSYSMEYCGENNLHCRIRLPEHIPPCSVTGEIRRNVFLAVKEILHNIVKHAGAKNVDIVFETTGSLDILIRDDGGGFRENHQTAGGNGFRNMQKRMEFMGGTLEIRNGNGITILLKLPMEGV